MLKLAFAALLLLVTATQACADKMAAEIVVYKSERKMQLLDAEGNVLKSYQIALGGEPEGPKTQEGDEKTPEGSYKISGRNEKSRYHRSLRISYPDEKDIEQAREKGVSPGGDIMIHGIRNGLGWIGSWHLVYDKWTDGCIAVTDDEIEEIWSMVPDDTRVQINP